MSTRKALVWIGGRFNQLPAGDTIEGTVDTSTTQSAIAGDKTWNGVATFYGPAATTDVNITTDVGAYAGRVCFYAGAIKVAHIGKTTGNGFSIRMFDTTTGTLIGDVVTVPANTIDPTFPGIAKFTSTATGASVTINGNANSPGMISGLFGIYHAAPDGVGLFNVYDTFGDSDAASSGYILRRARGSAASPTAMIAATSLIGQIQSRGFGTTIYPNASSASIQFRAAETFTDTAMGGLIQFKTTLNGTLTSSVRLNILNDGLITPGADGTQEFGSTSFRWAAMYVLTPAAGDSSELVATTAYAKAAAPNASYRVLLDCSCSHTAARAAGTYWMGQGDPAGVTGVGTLYPPNVIYIDPVDYPTVNGLATKLRLRAVVMPNDVAPGGSYTFGLYPITRPATSGGAAVGIITLGTVVAGSTVAVTPTADGLHNVAGSDFAIPAAGAYVIGFVTSAAVAASSHVLISAVLQQRNN
jgi:hypothetical protein